MQISRPVATVRPATPTPIPLWEAHRLFLEPRYTDGQPYDQPLAADRLEDDDIDSLAAA